MRNWLSRIYDHFSFHVCVLFTLTPKQQSYIQRSKKNVEEIEKKDWQESGSCLSINKTKTMGTLSSTRASNAVARIGIYCNEKTLSMCSLWKPFPLYYRQTHNCTGSYPRHFINISFYFLRWFVNNAWYEGLRSNTMPNTLKCVERFYSFYSNCLGLKKNHLMWCL